jgi:hypothetical protein
MNIKRALNRLIRYLSVSLLLITFFIQIIAVVFIDLDIGEFEMEEFHPVSGFAFFGAILIHLLVVRKSLKSIFFPKTQLS